MDTTYFLHLRFNPLAALADRARQTRRTIGNWIVSTIEARRYRHALNDLRRLDDRILKDIGLSRSGLWGAMQETDIRDLNTRRDQWLALKHL